MSRLRIRMRLSGRILISTATATILLGACGGTSPNASMRVEASVTPNAVGQLVLRSGPLQMERGDAWGSHDLIVENTGDSAITIEDTKKSSFIGDKQLLVAYEGCGYGRESEGGPIHDGVCNASARRVVVAPHSSTVLTRITISKDLRGMAPLQPGKFEFSGTLEYQSTAAQSARSTGQFTISYAVYKA